LSWLDVAGQLSRTGPGEVVHARRTLRDLARPARALRDCGVPGHPDCPFADHPARVSLCRIVPQLAALDVAAEGPVLDAREELLAALVESGDAVRWCRTTAHATGDCWFRTGTTRDCTDVLRLVLTLA
jgi:hypothetical protein